MPSKNSAVSTPNTIPKTPSLDAAQVCALTEKLKGWMERDLEFLGVSSGGIYTRLNSSEYVECQFSTDACNYTVLVYNDFSLWGFADVTDSVLWNLYPKKADEDWMLGDTGPFCEDAWQKLLLAIIGVEEEVASAKATSLQCLKVLQQRLEEPAPAASEAVPA